MHHRHRTGGTSNYSGCLDYSEEPEPRLTSALKEPRKPPKESVRLSTERGEAEASGERSLAAASGAIR